MIFFNQKLSFFGPKIIIFAVKLSFLDQKLSTVTVFQQEMAKIWQNTSINIINSRHFFGAMLPLAGNLKFFNTLMRNMGYCALFV